ncbi:hypothetical protein BT93_A0682 [Corymbia citriodora subsp. variegata]|nr:hypothetical protein BT93_A0682 [Corymbia citriodora subsp. variegata]
MATSEGKKVQNILLRGFRIIAFLGGNLEKSQILRTDNGVYSNSPSWVKAPIAELCAQFIDDHYMAWQIELETMI